MSVLWCRSASASAMAVLERGTPSASSSRTAGAVRATMASTAAGPARGEVAGWGGGEACSSRGMRFGRAPPRSADRERSCGDGPPRAVVDGPADRRRPWPEQARDAFRHDHAVIGHRGRRPGGRLAEPRDAAAGEEAHVDGADVAAEAAREAALPGAVE